MTQIDLEKRYRTLLTLWFALLLNIGVFFVFTMVAAPELSSEPGNAPAPVLALPLMAAGAFLVIASFVVKRKILERSVEKQEVSLVQTALVIACTMCEASAILGVVERLIMGVRLYYLLLLVAAIGTAFHFPRREQLLAASYKTFNNGVSS